MIPAMRRLGHDVVAVASGNADWAATYADRNGIPASGSVEDVIARDDIDAVYISSTNEHHRAQTELAAAAGKHVLCEKPLALSVEDGRAMLDGLRARRRHPGDQPPPARLGDPPDDPAPRRRRRGRARPRRPRLPRGHAAGAAPGLAARQPGGRRRRPSTSPATTRRCSTRSWVRFRPTSWPSPPARVRGSAAAEDAVMATLRYADGALVQTHDAFTDRVRSDRPAGPRVGRQPSSRRTCMTQDPIGTIVLRDASRRTGDRGPDDRRDLYEINVGAFAAAVRGEADDPTATGLDGLRAAQVALAVRQAAEIGERVASAERRPDRRRGGRLATVTLPSPVRSTIEPMDREAVCRFLAAIEHRSRDPAVLRALRREEPDLELRRHSHPYFELIFFIEGKANIDAGGGDRSTSSASTSWSIRPASSTPSTSTCAAGRRSSASGRTPGRRRVVRPRDQAHG